MCRILTAADAGAQASTIETMLRTHQAQLDADPDLPPDSAKLVDISTGVQDSEKTKEDAPRPKPAVMMPAGDGLVAMQPELAATVSHRGRI
jgi:hypothetical protein